jgi:hypothetical protein
MGRVHSDVPGELAFELARQPAFSNPIRSQDPSDCFGFLFPHRGLKYVDQAGLPFARQFLSAAQARK